MLFGNWELNSFDSNFMQRTKDVLSNTFFFSDTHQDLKLRVDRH